MEYNLVQPDGKLIPKSSGCWGALGRSDYYKLPCLKQMRDYNAKLPNYSSYRIPVKDYSSDDSYLMKHRDTIAIALTSDKGWGALFHKSAYNMMEYIVERSPFKVCFAEGTRFAECYKANRLDIRTDSCPAQITSTLLIWMRDIIRSSVYQRTYEYLVSLGFTEGIAFGTALHHPTLYAQRPSTSPTSREAFGKHPLDIWVDQEVQGMDLWNKYLCTFELTMKDMCGYPVIMIEQFNQMKGDMKPRYNKVELSTVRVAGLFKDIEYRGVPDVRSFVETFWGIK